MRRPISLCAQLCFGFPAGKHYPEEAPAHKVSVGGFWMDRHTVTNRDFRLFVEATGYRTLAERPANEADYPGALPDLLLPSSVVFKKARNRVDLRDWRGPIGSIRAGHEAR